MRTLEKNFKARPPVVVSGLPNMTPIFSRSWLMKMQVVFDFEGVVPSFRRACDIRRACRPTLLSPISPSISARGTRAATLSMTMASMALERTSMSQISSACSPVSGWEMRTSSYINPKTGRIGRIECMLGVDEGDDAAERLGLGENLKGKRGFTA